MESSSSPSPSASQELNEVQAGLPSSVRPVLRTGAPNNNMVMGKHRLAAAIAALNHQINIIQVINYIITPVIFRESCGRTPTAPNYII